MIKLINLTSIWEIGFAINAVLVYIDVLPKLNEFYLKNMSEGEIIIRQFVRENDQRYVMTNRWHGLLFKYANLVILLKLLSLISSFVALGALIWAGFSPEAGLGIFSMILLLIVVLAPSITLIVYIIFVFPRYKYLCIKEALEHLIESELKTISSITDPNKINETQTLIKRYKGIIKIFRLKMDPISRFGTKAYDDFVEGFDDLYK